jgi:hypothetical protein
MPRHIMQNPLAPLAAIRLWCSLLANVPRLTPLVVLALASSRLRPTSGFYKMPFYEQIRFKALRKSRGTLSEINFSF